VNTVRNYAKFTTVALSAALLSAVFFFAAAPQARADDRDKCRQRIERAEAKLDQAIRHHGERSHQAESRRHELNQERERCWNRYHGWWDGHERRWREDRDWDRDHDHDHDHH
jgi:hypothetical protein